MLYFSVVDHIQATYIYTITVRYSFDSIFPQIKIVAFEVCVQFMALWFAPSKARLILYPTARVSIQPSLSSTL